mgnify:CR=1 FL=1
MLTTLLYLDLKKENGKLLGGYNKALQLNRSKIDLLLAQKNELKKTASGFGSAMAKFKSLDNCGIEEVTSASKNRTGHYNTVNKISVLSDQAGKAIQLSTSSLDGNLIIWNVNEVIANNGLSQLNI